MSTSEGSDAHVRFIDVHKSFDGTTNVVEDVNLDIARGEFLTFLGPSGSGKSTCLMMLAGFEEPSQGEILVDGKPVHHVPPHKRTYGIVFQDYALFPHMTVAKNLSFPLEVRGIDQAKRSQMVADALDLVRLTGFGDRKPHQLSGGQRQRVAIARALVYEPDLILMDEPLGALDRKLREQLQDEIRRIHDQLGVTMIYVTHDQGEAMVMSDRIAVFSEGGIKQLATPITLYEEPTDTFVADFIGDNNHLQGTVADLVDDVCQVSVEDQTIFATPVGDLAKGQSVTLVIRPERVIFQLDQADTRNSVSATVQHVTFVGDHIRVQLNTCGSTDFIAKIPNIAGHGRVLEGDQIKVGWATLDCRAIPSP